MAANGERPRITAQVDEDLSDNMIAGGVDKDYASQNRGERNGPTEPATKIEDSALSDQEREWEADWQEHEYYRYLSETAAQKPDLLTRTKIVQIAGKFQTIKELSAGGYEPNSWLVQRLIPSDSIVTLQGQAKSGKSTFILHMVKELIAGGQFLGQKLAPTKVVYVTEQNRKSFLSQLESADIDPESTNLTALTVEGTLGFVSWKNLFQACEMQVLKTSAKLLVIDSWGRFTGITEQEENKTAPVQERITELRKLVTNTGATVLILHHVRKSGGGIIEAGMGSSALVQQVDVVLSMSGQPEQEDVPASKVNGPECRMIQSKGRFPDMMNDEQVKWEKDNHRYVLVGGAAHAQTTKQKLFNLLPADPQNALDAEGLAAEYTAVHGRIVARTVENHFADLKKEGSVRQQDGTGIKGIPAKLYRER